MARGKTVGERTRNLYLAALKEYAPIMETEAIKWTGRGAEWMPGLLAVVQREGLARKGFGERAKYRYRCHQDLTPTNYVDSGQEDERGWTAKVKPLSDGWSDCPPVIRRVTPPLEGCAGRCAVLAWPASFLFFLVRPWRRRARRGTSAAFRRDKKQGREKTKGCWNGPSCSGRDPVFGREAFFRQLFRRPIFLHKLLLGADWGFPAQSGCLVSNGFRAILGRAVSSDGCFGDGRINGRAHRPMARAHSTSFQVRQISTDVRETALDIERQGRSVLQPTARRKRRRKAAWRSPPRRAVVVQWALEGRGKLIPVDERGDAAGTVLGSEASSPKPSTLGFFFLARCRG